MSTPMRIARFLPVVAFVAAAFPAHAVGGRSFLGEDTAILTARWEVAAPIGDLKNLVDQASLEGFSGDLRFALGKSNFSLGVAASWNRFNGGTPNTVVYATAPQLVFHGYLSRSGVQPYLGVGAGGVYTETTVGSAPRVSSWSFCADPQLGLLVTVTPELALDIRLHYEWTTAKAAGVKNYQWAGLGVGFGLY